jgi:hypothetical protein
MCLPLTTGQGIMNHMMISCNYLNMNVFAITEPICDTKHALKLTPGGGSRAMKRGGAYYPSRRRKFLGKGTLPKPMPDTFAQSGNCA